MSAFHTKPSGSGNRVADGLKIALVILHADARRGGAEKYTLQIAEALARRGHMVSLLATTHAVALPGVEHMAIEASSGTKTGQYLGLLDWLDNHLATNEYDVVHAMLPVRRCDLYHPHAGLASVTIASGHQKHSNPFARGLSWICNQSNPRRRSYATVEEDLLNGPKVPGVLCLSDYVRAAAQQQFSLPEEKLHRLFNAVDLERFAPDSDPSARRALRERFGIGAHEPVGLMVAQDFARKGLAGVIQAMEQLQKRSMRLLVIGRDNPAPYKRQAKMAGLQEAVLFAGATDDVRPFYNAADFMVMPTRHDPCSLVVLEALAMGVPVISTRFNGACEIMRDGTHGYVLADPGDVWALAAAMHRMLDSERRARMSEACLELRPLLDFDGHVDQLLTIYREIKSARDKRAPRGLALSQ